MLTIIILIVVWNVVAHNYALNFHKSVHEKPVMFSYDTTRGVLNPVMIITDVEYKDELIKYYDKWNDGISNPVFNFPLNSVLFKKPVYVIGYSSDSLLAEIVYYITDEENSNYVKGFIDRRTLHKKPAPEALWEIEENFQYEIDSLYYYDSVRASY